LIRTSLARKSSSERRRPIFWRNGSNRVAKRSGQVHLKTPKLYMPTNVFERLLSSATTAKEFWALTATCAELTRGSGTFDLDLKHGSIRNFAMALRAKQSNQPCGDTAPFTMFKNWLRRGRAVTRELSAMAKRADRKPRALIFCSRRCWKRGSTRLAGSG